MKNIKKILSLLLSLLFLFFVVYYIYTYFDNKETDAQKFEEEYTKLEEDNLFVYRTSDEIIKILEKGTGIIYLGFPECKWCQAYVPMLNEVAKEQKVSEIYYLNIKNDRSENTDSYKKIVFLLKEFLNFDNEGNERIFVPSVTVVKDGKIIGYNDETSMISGDINPKDYWTPEKKLELNKTLSNMILPISNIACSSCNK